MTPSNDIGNGGQNVNIYHVEGAENLREVATYWNIGTQRWLKKYIFLNVLKEDGSGATWATFVTFFVSAFWHGFHAGYYLSFLSLALATALLRMSRKTLRPWFLTSPMKKRVYHVLGMLMTSFLLNYLVIPFQLLTFDKSIKAFSHVHYYGHLVIGIAMVLLKIKN
jgi:lysophospholipid acyltransferase